MGQQLKEAHDPLLAAGMTSNQEATRNVGLIGTLSVDAEPTEENSNLEIEFVDVENITKPGINKIDIENVILTNGQKADLVRQAMRGR